MLLYPNVSNNRAFATSTILVRDENPFHEPMGQPVLFEVSRKVTLRASRLLRAPIIVPELTCPTAIGVAISPNVSSLLRKHTDSHRLQPHRVGQRCLCIQDRPVVQKLVECLVHVAYNIRLVAVAYAYHVCGHGQVDVERMAL